MWINLLTLIFFFFIMSSLINKNYLLTIILIVAGIIVLSITPLIRRKITEATKEEVKQALKENTKQAIININKHPWYIIELLPGFDRISAKRAVFLRHKFGKYKDIQDFFDKNNIKEEFKNQIMLIAEA